MNTKNLVRLVIVLIFSTLIELKAQIVYKAIPAQSKIEIKGTSTLHNWEMISTDMFCVVTAKNETTESPEIVKFDFSMKAKSLKSGKSMMDNIAYDALKASKFPEIKFLVESLQAAGKSGSELNETLNGKITIAGVTKSVQTKIKRMIGTDGKTVVKGSLPIKMTDFGVEPPTALMGTIKTGNAITVDFALEFQKQ